MSIRWVVPLAVITILAVASCAQQPTAGGGGSRQPMAGGSGSQQPGAEGGAVPFATFAASLESQTYRDYADRPGTRVRDQQAFDEMRGYLIAYYHNAHATATHVISGAVFDCLTRGPAPANPPAPAASPDVSPGAAVQPSSCPEGSIPVRRLTLDQLVRFPTLQEYLAKSPGGSGQLPPIGQHG